MTPWKLDASAYARVFFALRSSATMKLRRPNADRCMKLNDKVNLGRPQPAMRANPRLLCFYQAVIVHNEVTNSK